MYKRIKQKEPIPKMYAERLIAEGATTRADVDALLARIDSDLENELLHAKATKKRPEIGALGGVWKGFLGGPDGAAPDVDTGVGRPMLERIGQLATRLPDGFAPHPKIAKLLEQRRAMTRGEQSLDWGAGEMLAFGSLLLEGTLVRLSGQDSCRGTFSQRHAVIVDQNTGEEYTPLARMTDGQGSCSIYDSALSEAAVMGFELGYSLDYPDGLVMWEAQFGDFVNGAQVILDQFVSSSEDKWKRLSGLVLLLPHGYEGQGPEHSSARFERFLQLCAEDNIQVVYPTTPAQYFHVLRRQVIRKWRKPLIVMTPKSLLRLPAAASPIDDFATGKFQRAIGDADIAPAAAKRVMVCTGKVYYDLVDERAKRKDTATPIVRLEQLYPLADEALAAILAPYPGAKEVIWVQEEPANMGAQSYIVPRLSRVLGKRTLRTAARVESASPATGSHHAHQIELRQLLDEAFRA
jgi:2-oxoglutarate dehydrogenase E1 component